MMESPLFTQAALERLSTRSLARLADQHDIDVPPELERVFIIEALLELSVENAAAQEAVVQKTAVQRADAHEKSAPRGRGDKPHIAPLPARYAFTFIDVLVRDPLWIFVFWELRDDERARIETENDFRGYHLKVEREADEEPRPREKPFRVPVERDENAWYVGFPEPLGGRYTVSLCARFEGSGAPSGAPSDVKNGAPSGDTENARREERVLVRSRPFTLPVQVSRALSASFSDAAAARLFQLSGGETFPIFREKSRPSRNRPANEKTPSAADNKVSYL
jgi:hypothetical protein